ncbi:phage integrase N-terminal SAM-like domain-containing protein [Phaeobacter sp. J2-8]|uniref:phage integrase N-terminal SAM-like domain-containing protein n=1 Tax=Phaeobacter sp. J2-8 TaxID=2931394 RepID=UPI001FD5D8C5|nr:phage integrase N-terminal SAM-like domain-containing protein [Phaeobacter sp. J2-8]MCJ7872667.1 phage integrase N-terminal SAM-like domain-containing protein [Phaeobacter sp. J2-8]
MKEEKMTPLRERMIEDMHIPGMSPKTQQGYIKEVRNFAEFIGRSPDIATPDELRADQLHMTDNGVPTGVLNTRIVSLRILFGMSCGHEEMKLYMQFRRKPMKQPVVLGIQEMT